MAPLSHLFQLVQLVKCWQFFWSWMLKDFIKVQEKKRKSTCVHVLHTTWNSVLSRCSRAATARKLMRCYGFLLRIIRNGVLLLKFLFPIFSFLTSWSDINECSSSKGGCSHTCHNSAGSFTCSCPTGMELDSGKRSCKGKIGISNCFPHPLFEQLFMFLSDYSFNYSLWSLSIFLFLFLASFFGRNSAQSLI